MGSGFDSRAYRLSGGTWIELDHPEVIRFKNERLPVAECKNRLVRIPINFALESIRDVLSPFKTNDRIVLVAEGVFFYMDREAMETLIETLKALFPKHLLIGDLLNRKFLKKYATPLHEAFQELGAHFQDVVDEPERLFLESGYRLHEKVSIVGSAVKAGRLRRGPRFLFPLFRTAINGFAIHVFDYP
jgi:O-methyltransferase involved in polyketide biosynthesis